MLGKVLAYSSRHGPVNVRLKRGECFIPPEWKAVLAPTFVKTGLWVFGFPP